MLETQHLAIPSAGLVDIADRARYLADRTEAQLRRRHGYLLVRRAAVGGTAFRHPGPALKVSAATQAELRYRVADVIFHGVAADPAAHGDPCISQPVPVCVHDRPFGWGQDVVVRRAAAAPSELLG